MIMATDSQQRQQQAQVEEEAEEVTLNSSSKFVTRIHVSASGEEDVFESLCESVIIKSELSIQESAKMVANLSSASLRDASSERLRDDSKIMSDISLDASGIVCQDVSFSEFCMKTSVQQGNSSSSSSSHNIGKHMNGEDEEGDADSAHGSSIDTATTTSATTVANGVVKELSEPCEADLLEDIDTDDDDDDDETEVFADQILEKCKPGTEEYQEKYLTPFVHLNSSTDISLPTTSADRSPSSHSVKSMSALSPLTGKYRPSHKKSSAFSSSWLSGLRKKSLTSLFDQSASKSDQDLAVVETCEDGPLPERANSAGDCKELQRQQQRQMRRRTLRESKKNRQLHSSPDFETAVRAEEEVPEVSLARLATSDLRNLELRERRCLSIENGFQADEVISDAESFNRDEDDDHEDGKEGATRSLKVPSPHPQAYFTLDYRRNANKNKRSMRDRKLVHGVKQFNLDSKRGLQYLVENGFLPPAPVQEKDDDDTNDKSKNAVDDKNAGSSSSAARLTAQFLFREGRLSKRQIGQFIGGHADFNQTVLKEFVRCHEFTHLILVQALRQFLWSFRLPGEAMQIDRIMEAFAERYCQQNPNLFEETDTCYILSFSIIMLNTALHNPNVPQKITMEQFIKQNRGINSGKDLPKDILELIYKSIKEEPFKIPDETYDDLIETFFSPEKEGWLLKQGGSWKTWKRRWFVLSDRCLYYFQHTTENVPKGIIPLENVKVRTLEANNGLSFEIFSESTSVIKACKTDSKGAVVQGNHKSYVMLAKDKEERDEWIRVLRGSIRDYPFHDIIASKKAALVTKKAHNSSVVGTPSASTPATPKKLSTVKAISGPIASTPKVVGTPKKGSTSLFALTPKRGHHHGGSGDTSTGATPIKAKKEIFK